jgi:hypothetical protein
VVQQMSLINSLFGSPMRGFHASGVKFTHNPVRLCEK